MPSVDLSDETYEELIKFMKKLEPHGARFGQKITEDGAITEALVTANLMR
ncbi:MAG: hypothetical protein ABSF83_07615 [Nitrososphaerales archaeon]|jgi:hypothetical protein